MPPISLRLTPWLYIHLHSITETARNMTLQSSGSKQSLLQFPMVLSLADIKVIHPHTVRFPRKGKRVKLTLSQTAALHTMLQSASVGPMTQPTILQLLSLVDKALTDYNAHYGYRG